MFIKGISLRANLGYLAIFDENGDIFLPPLWRQSTVCVYRLHGASSIDKNVISKLAST